MEHEPETTPTVRVLVISDAPETSERLVRDVLPGGGYEPVPMLALSDPAPADLILLDVSQLRSEPFAGLKAQRAAGNVAPALLCAPRLTGDMAAEVFDLDIRDFVRKPVGDQELLARLAALSASSRHERERVDHEQRQVELEQRLENAQAALQRRIDEMDALSRVGWALARVEDRATLLERVVEAAVFLGRADESLVYLRDVSGQLALRAHYGVDEGRIGALWHPSTDSLMAQVLETGQPVARSDASEDSKVTTSYFVRQALAVPIFAGQEVTGVLTMHRRGERPIDGSDQAVMRSLADYTGMALDRIQSAEELKERVDQALTAARLVRAHVDTLAGPIDGVYSNAEALLDGEFGALNPEQDSAVRRIRLAAARLDEIAGLVHETLAEFDEARADETPPAN